MTVLLIGIVATSWQRNKAREALQQVQRSEITRRHDYFMHGLLRGQPDADLADILIDEASDRGASDEWLFFHRGLASLFRQKYEDAIGHFQHLPEDTSFYVSANALLAIAYMWAGDEFRYFDTLNDLSERNPSEFEDKFFLGYAFTWGNPRRAHELLDAADKSSPGHQYVIFLRGVAARGRASIELTKLDEIRKFIDLAIEDLRNSERLMPDSPLGQKELTLAHLHRAKIYQRLAESDLPNSEQHLSTVKEAKPDAIALLDRQQANEESSDAQYALVMLLSELGPQDELIRVADSWKESGMEVSLYPAQFLAIEFATLGDDLRAGFWLRRHQGKFPSQLNVETFVKLVNPARSESISDLRADARDRADAKLRLRKTENLSFDVMSLMLLGDKSYLHHYKDDRLESLIGGGEAYKPMLDYFSRNSSQPMAPDDVIARCQDSPVPNASEMHANFYLAMEAIAKRNWVDAERRLNACRDGGEFMFSVYFLSELLLTRWGQREPE